eukprot:5276000-Pleurochrysis_carterae.AAC.1
MCWFPSWFLAGRPKIVNRKFILPKNCVRIGIGGSDSESDGNPASRATQTPKRIRLRSSPLLFVSQMLIKAEKGRTQ